MIYNFDISEFITLITKHCNKVQKKNFKKGQTITEYLYKYHQICILLDGSAELVRYDLNGRRTIIGSFTKNDVFGSALYPSNTNNQLEVKAKKNSSVLFFDYNTILNGCKNKCDFHD